MVKPPPPIRKRSLGRLAAAAVVGLCVYGVIDFESGAPSNHLRAGRRSLLSTLYLSGPSTLLPWAEHHLVDVTEAPDVDAETALFWRELRQLGMALSFRGRCSVSLVGHLCTSITPRIFSHARSPLSKIPRRRNEFPMNRHSQIGGHHRQTPLPMHGPDPRASRGRRSSPRSRPGPRAGHIRTPRGQGLEGGQRRHVAASGDPPGQAIRAGPEPHDRFDFHHGTSNRRTGAVRRREPGTVPGLVPSSRRSRPQVRCSSLLIPRVPIQLFLVARLCHFL